MYLFHLKKLLTKNEFYRNYRFNLDLIRDNIKVIRDPNQKIDFWKLLKDAIGKDLTKITMPGIFYSI